MTDWFEQFARFMQTTTGVVVQDSQRHAVDQRLSPVAARLNIKTVDELARTLLLHRDPKVVAMVADAMMTNETFFFRDRQPFDLFRNTILPRLAEQKRERRRIRIWSAACATGQEPYSLAMVLDEEARRFAGWTIEIVASDLSGAALETARNGLYNQFEMQRGLPISMLLRYFNRDKDKWKVAEHIRSRVQFRQINLVNDFAQLGTFDVIFCRNVLMYFSPEGRKSVLGRMARAMEPRGMLTLGSTEFVSGTDNPFVAMKDNPSLLLLRAAEAGVAERDLAIA